MHEHEGNTALVPYVPLPEVEPGMVRQCVETTSRGLPLLIVVKGLYRDEREYIPLKVGDNLARVLMDLSPDRWGGSGIALFKNCLSRDTGVDLQQVPHITIKPDDLFIAYVGAAEPISATILAAVLIGTVGGIVAGSIGIGLLLGGLVIGGALVGMYLFETPKIRTPESSGDIGTGQGTLGIPQNRPRLGSRIADIFGFMRTWPDLIAPVVDEYNGTDYKMTIWYCIGIGDFAIGADSIKFGDTDITRFTGTTVQIITPDLVPFGLQVLRATDESRGFKLDPANPGDAYPYSPWVTLPGEKNNEIWVDIMFPGGLIQYKSDGDPTSQWVDVEIQYRSFIGGVAGGIVTVTRRFQKNTAGTLRFTHRIATGGTAAYQVRVRKTGRQGSEDNIHIHECEIGRLAGLSNTTVEHRLYSARRTYMKVVVNSSRQAGPSSYENLNLCVSRYMAQITSVDGPTAWNPTVRWCDAMATMLTDPYTGQYLGQSVDWEALLNVQAAAEIIDPGISGQFSHIYDRFMDVDEQLQSCANAVRAAVCQDYGQVTVIRDQGKGLPSALITPQNRTEDDVANRTLSFRSADDNDGIEIEWFDFDNNFVKRVYQYPTGITILNPRKISLVGCTRWPQVYRRAVFEWTKQRRRRRTATVTMYEEGMTLLPMDLIELAEPWDVAGTSWITGYFAGTSAPYTHRITVWPGLDVSPGDALAISGAAGRATDFMGLLASTSGYVTEFFIERQPNVIVSGEGQAFNVFVSGHPGTVQAPSRVFVEGISTHDASRWLVGTVKVQDGKALVQLIEYDPEIYAIDTQPTIPNNPAIRE